MYKRIIALIAVALMACSLLVGCKSQAPAQETAATAENAAPAEAAATARCAATVLAPSPLWHPMTPRVFSDLLDSAAGQGNRCSSRS